MVVVPRRLHSPAISFQVSGDREQEHDRVFHVARGVSDHDVEPFTEQEGEAKRHPQYIFSCDHDGPVPQNVKLELLGITRTKVTGSLWLGPVVVYRQQPGRAVLPPFLGAARRQFGRLSSPFIVFEPSKVSRGGARERR
jgi:hypothetical protein